MNRPNQAIHTPPPGPADPAKSALVARLHANGWLREAARIAGDADEVRRLDAEAEALGRRIDGRDG